MINMHDVAGQASVVFLTLDCPRCDVAQQCVREGTTPNLARLLPSGGWELRETPGTLTLPGASGFLPRLPADAVRRRSPPTLRWRWSSRGR
jgi:hypothetical protein